MLRIFAAIAIAAAIASSCHATLVEWDGLAGASQPANNLVTGVTGLPLTRGAGISSASGGNFNSNGFSASTLADAILSDEYLSFGATADAGFALDFSTIEVELDRSGTGPDTVYLLSSADSFTSPISSEAIRDPGAVLTFDLSSLDTAEGTTEFRFYYSGASSASGTSDIEDDILGGLSGATGLRLSGLVVAAVPEPTAALFGSLLAGALGLTIARRPQSRD